MDGKNPFRAYKLKFNKYERGYLTDEELELIENKHFAIERLLHVKDFFIFSCCTGLTYTDTINLTPHNLIKGVDNETGLITKRQKTGTPVKIPLLPKAIEIVDNYRTNIKSLAEGSLFPKISNQRLNGYLKEMADVCEIEKNLTFHLARHTFATIVHLKQWCAYQVCK